MLYFFHLRLRAVTWIHLQLARVSVDYNCVGFEVETLQLR